MDQAGLGAGWRRGLPVVLPTFALGISFGVLAEPVLGPMVSVLMSALVFGGGAQFAALSVLAGGGTGVAAVIAGSLMNTRFVAMSLAMAPSLRGNRWKRMAESQAIVDASFVMADRRDGSFDRSVFFSVTLLQYVAWTAGTVGGVIIGSSLAHPDAFGLDAIFPAFYLALLYGELAAAQRRVVAGLAAVVTLIFMSFAPPGIPIIAGALAALWGLRGR
jgi:4-azaleucine resistance transporter AzlC